MNKFYEIKNIIPQKSADLYIYGEIVTDNTNWWTGEKDDTLVGLKDFKEELDNLEDILDLNIYLNTPGGEVFVASTMCSMLQRLKDNGTKIHTFVDGLCASAGTFILMMGDDINMYQNSMIMIHKPVASCYGNALELQKCINLLNTIESSTMIPLYMKKALKSEEEIQKKIDNESWMGSTEASIYFDINVLEDVNKVVACVDKNIFKNYKHVPNNLKKLLNKTEEQKKEYKVDYSLFEKRLENI